MTPHGYRLAGLEHIRGAGHLVALARIAVDVGGGAQITLHSIRVRLSQDGRIVLTSPTWRRATGEWRDDRRRGGEGQGSTPRAAE